MPDFNLKPWYDLAIKERGVIEGPDEIDNPRVVAYYKDAGFPGVKHDSVPWCAAFVGAMLVRAGYEPSHSLLARSYLNVGLTLQRPIVGCIVIRRRGKSSFLGHVFFYVDRGLGLGGNQRDMVSIAPYNELDVLGYRWPIVKLGEKA